MNASEYAIDVRGVTKQFAGKVVVDHIDMRVKRGEIYGFLGPNGSGKTTFLRMLCGLLTPNAGEGHCLGHDFVADSAAIKRSVGYMTQRFSYYEDLSIAENLDFIARMYGVRDRRRVVRDSIERLGLAGREHQLAGTLSGGWKQRLALAASLIHAPRLLLLDEPTAGVDPKARRDFWEQLHMLAGQGLTVLITTHYMDEAERCHRLAYIAYGKLLTVGTPADVVRQAGLVTWELHGPEPHGVTHALRAQPGVEQVVAFGNSVHVSGRNAAQLEGALTRWRQDPAWTCRSIEPSLEDVFISLLRQATDNFSSS